MLPHIIAATLTVSLLSLVGILFIGMREDILTKLTDSLVSFAVGGLLGGAFFHLLPESLEAHNPIMFTFVLVGIIGFFLIEKLLHWRHCHQGHCDVHIFAYMNLIGDGVHNFIDGMIIATAFMTDPHLGIATTIAVAAHEIPQEIGDFGILIYAGLSRTKAIFYNFLTALIAVAGAISTYYAIDKIMWLKDCLIPITAGGFIYIALVDMMPELHKRAKGIKIIAQIIIILLGLSLMWLLKKYF